MLSAEQLLEPILQQLTSGSELKFLSWISL